MALIVEREIARADMNDEFGVSIWQEHKLVEYTPDEARQLAREITAAADEADAIQRADEQGDEPKRTSLIIDPADGTVVL